MRGARTMVAGVVVVGALVAGALPASAAPTLVALWKMNETSGNVMRDSIGGHDGSLHAVQLGQSGFKGTAYGFTGSSYASVPSSSSLNPGSRNITITVHLKATGVPPSGGDWDVIRKGYFETSGGEFKVEYQPSGQASCGFNGSAGYGELIAGPRLNNNQWHTVRCVKTASSIQLVVDGQTFSKSANIGSFSNSEPVVIGSRPGAQFFRGVLDHVSIRIG